MLRGDLISCSRGWPGPSREILFSAAEVASGEILSPAVEVDAGAQKRSYLLQSRLMQVLGGDLNSYSRSWPGPSKEILSHAAEVGPITRRRSYLL